MSKKLSAVILGLHSILSNELMTNELLDVYYIRP
jgi:hypothetical protein